MKWQYKALILYCNILLYNIQLYSLEIKRNICKEQYPKVNLMFFIYFFIQVVYNNCFFKSIWFVDQMIQTLFKVTRKT